MWSIRSSFQILMEFEFSRQVFESHSDIKIQENLSYGQTETDGRT
jgi:hypothetical protein